MNPKTMPKMHVRATDIRRVAVGAFLAVVIIACGPAYDDEAPRTIETLVPEHASIREQQSMPFELDGREVRLTHVAYGSLDDCPSGCISSHVCAIEDGPDVLLFYAFWSNDAEEPKSVKKDCPTLSHDETWRECEPPGLLHPVTNTDELREFAHSDDATKGPFRWCLNRYTLESARF